MKRWPFLVALVIIPLGVFLLPREPVALQARSLGQANETVVTQTDGTSPARSQLLRVPRSEEWGSHEPQGVKERKAGSSAAGSTRSLEAVVELALDLAENDTPPSELQSAFDAQGLKAKSRTAGNPKTGERLEIDGTGSGNPVRAVHAIYDVFPDGRQEFSSLRYELSLGSGQNEFSELLGTLTSKFGAEVRQERLEGDVGRWVFPDTERVVWVRRSTEPDGSQLVMLTTEHLLE